MQCSKKLYMAYLQFSFFLQKKKVGKKEKRKRAPEKVICKEQRVIFIAPFYDPACLVEVPLLFQSQSRIGIDMRKEREENFFADSLFPVQSHFLDSFFPNGLFLSFRNFGSFLFGRGTYCNDCFPFPNVNFGLADSKQGNCLIRLSRLGQGLFSPPQLFYICSKQ